MVFYPLTMGEGALYAPPPLWFYALYNLQATHTRKFLTSPNFLLRIPHEKKLQKFCFNPAQSTFGTPSTKIYIFFFALIKKFFLQTLVETILRYHKIFCRVFGPPVTPYVQAK